LIIPLINFKINKIKQSFMLEKIKICNFKKINNSPAISAFLRNQNQSQPLLQIACIKIQYIAGEPDSCK